MFSSKPTVINSPEDDLFGQYEKIAFIMQFIEDQIKDGGFLSNLESNGEQKKDSNNDRMIALYGGRGSGKSTIMKTLCESKDSNLQLDGETIKPIIFEAWRYEGDDNLPLSLFHFLGREICGGRMGWEESITKIHKIRAGISGLISGFGMSAEAGIPKIANMTLSFSTSGAIAREKELLNKYREEIENNEIYQKSYFEKIEDMKGGFETLSKLVRKDEQLKNKKIVVFIDDLDRCESENVIELLTAIKLFFTYAEDIVFVVGVDKQAVTRALKSKYNNDEEKAEEYLEKIFPINFTCDVIDDINQIIDKSGIIDEQLRNQIKDMVTTIGFNNPRHLQRYLNKRIIVEKLFFKMLQEKNLITETKNLEDYEMFLLCWYAYLFEFERELFDKTTNLPLKLSEYKKRINKFEESNGKEYEFSQYIKSLDNKKIYLMPFPSKVVFIDSLAVFGGGVIDKMMVLKNKGLGSENESAIFDKILDYIGGMLLLSGDVSGNNGSDKVEMINEKIDYEAIITTIQTIF